MRIPRERKEGSERKRGFLVARTEGEDKRRFGKNGREAGGGPRPGRTKPPFDLMPPKWAPIVSRKVREKTSKKIVLGPHMYF